MKTPADKKIAFTFGSHPMKDPAQCWTAVLEFAPGSDENSVLPIRITDGNGELVAEAVFEFAGQRLAVKDGAAEIPYADFIRGKSSVPLWLHRRGIESVPGGLTFA